MSTYYKLYVENFGKVQSGAKLEQKDYGRYTQDGFEEFDEKEMVSVSMAVQNVKKYGTMKTKNEFEEELDKYIS